MKIKGHTLTEWFRAFIRYTALYHYESLNNLKHTTKWKWI